MHLFEKAQMILSNREIAYALWILFLIIISLFVKGTWVAIVSLIKSLLYWKFIALYVFLGGYLYYMVKLLIWFSIWDTTHLKDSLIWFITIATPLLFSLTKAEDTKHFKNILISCFVGTILIEFILNLYSFSILIEVILLPFYVLCFITMMQTSGQSTSKVPKLMSNILVLLGSSMFLYSVYQSIIDFKSIWNLQTFFTLIIPSVLTILLIPFLYCLSQIMIYETFFVDLDFMTIHKEKTKVVKWYIFKTALFSVNKLSRIKENFKKKSLYGDLDLKAYIREISKKGYS